MRGECVCGGAEWWLVDDGDGEVGRYAGVFISLVRMRGKAD